MLLIGKPWRKLVFSGFDSHHGYMENDYFLKNILDKSNNELHIPAEIVKNKGQFRKGNKPWNKGRSWDALKVREQASMDATVLTSVPKGEELEVVEQLDGWVKVSIDGEDAYVSSDYVTVEEKLDTAVTMSELLYGQGVSDLRVDIVEYAKQFLGNKYVYGGSSLTKGTDCSGFTMSVYKHFGISLSHSSRAQANEGKKITAADLQPGDLIFYGGSSGSINHVAMYIGGGKVIHASSPKTGIKISNYTYRTPVKYVSIIRD